MSIIKLNDLATRLYNGEDVIDEIMQKLGKPKPESNSTDRSEDLKLIKRDGFAYSRHDRKAKP
jgi:hypothetical protein